jgi:hypothetical protein
MISQHLRLLMMLGCTVALLGCVSPEKKAEKTIKEGVSKQDILSNMGKPVEEYSVADIVKCRKDVEAEAAAINQSVGNSSDFSDVFTATMALKRNENKFVACGPIEYFTGHGYTASDNVTMSTYERNDWITRVYPATATTTVFGNTAFTTFYEGGQSTTQKRCVVHIYFVRDVVDKVRFFGNDCPK